MKKSSILILLTLSIIIFGCSEQLPPSPPPPGHVGVGSAIAGLATAFPSWAANPVNAAVTPSEAKFGDSVVVSASNYDFIYKNGYVFNSKTRIWERFDLQGELTKDWLKSQAVGTVAVDSTRFGPGENYLVVYACSKVDSKWNCNNNHWMLLKFNILSPIAGIPELALVDQFVINKAIQPFAVTGTTAEYDNLEEINLTRYDARYREPNGLTVLVHVFDVPTREGVDSTMNGMFRALLMNGLKKYSGNNIAVFLDESDNRVAVWTSGKEIIYIETHHAESANKEVIDEYLKKYPSDLKPLV